MDSSKISLIEVTKLIAAENARRGYPTKSNSGPTDRPASDESAAHVSAATDESAALESAAHGSDVDHLVTHGLAAAKQLDAMFGTNSNLAVYGTLAPGRQNYHIVQPLGGDWTDGLIEGDLQETGWGATLGYPAFRPKNGGPILRIQVLKSQKLPEGWEMVDEFEGPEYHRILVPVFLVEDEDACDSRRLYTVANIYAAQD